ncbi:MAG: glycerol-3-phosphate acyltransferase [candidate division WOR-3 bacterium]
MNILLSVITGYLFGSIPFSFLIGKIIGKKDLRKTGTKNIGGSNVAREVGFIFGVIAILLDMVKGIFSIILIKLSGLSSPYTFISAFFAVVGHSFPIFLKFHGGRGMATSLGVMLYFSFRETVLSFLIFSPLFILKEVGLGTILAFSLIPVFIFFIKKDINLFFFSLTILIFLIFRRLYFLKDDIKEKRPFLKTFLNRLLFDAPVKIKYK